MRNIVTLGWLSLALLTACSQRSPETPPHRAQLRKLSANTLELIPAAGQLPYCLIYTLSAKGVVRQLTLNRENRSIPCEAGRPIGNVSYRIPVAEGKVRILVFFSDQRLNAGSVAEQVYELAANNPKLSAMDLRLPGKVNVEQLEFTPEPETQAQEGVVVGGSGGNAPASPPAAQDAETAAPGSSNAATP